MQISGMRIQRLRLLANCLGHVWVAMSNVRNVVVHVEVFAAIAIVKPHTLASHDVHGLIVKQPIGGAHQLLSAIEKG